MPTLAEKFYCQSSGAPVRMIKLTMEREITPYVWVRPDGRRFDFHEKAAGQYPAASRAQNLLVSKKPRPPRVQEICIG
jgi:hypothetical protein